MGTVAKASRVNPRARPRTRLQNFVVVATMPEAHYLIVATQVNPFLRALAPRLYIGAFYYTNKEAMMLTSQYTIRPFLKADAPVIARLDQLVYSDPMTEKQIKKMNSRQHIVTMLSENEEGVCCGYTMYLRTANIVDVIRLCKHPEFDGVAMLEPLVKWLKGRVSPKEQVVVIAVEFDDLELRKLLMQTEFELDANTLGEDYLHYTYGMRL